MKGIRRRSIRVLAVTALLLLSGILAADDAQDTRDIVGKWKEPCSQTFLEFKKDGTLIGADKQERKWRIAKGKMIVITVNKSNQPATAIFVLKS